MLAISPKPVEFFHPDPTNPRKDFLEAELQPLGLSLGKGQLVPLIARKSGMIVDGERRWRAAKLVGLQTLDAILIEDTVSAAEVKRIQLVTALQRADLKPYEVFCGFQEWLKSHPGATAKDLAQAIDRSEAAVSMTLSLSRCIKSVQEAAALGKLGLKDWYGISQASEEQMAAMLIAKLNGASAEGLKRMRRKPGNAVRLARVKCAMPSGVIVTLTGEGDGLTLGDVIETLTDLLKEAKKANDQGLDSKTFSAVLRDKAKAS
jgi:ParB family chromosome partitioning protein